MIPNNSIDHTESSDQLKAHVNVLHEQANHQIDRLVMCGKRIISNSGDCAKNTIKDLLGDISSHRVETDRIRKAMQNDINQLLDDDSHV